MAFKNKNLLVLISVLIIFSTYMIGIRLSGIDNVIAQESPSPTPDESPSPTPTETPTPSESPTPTPDASPTTTPNPNSRGNDFMNGLYIGTTSYPPSVGSGSAILEGGAYLNSSGSAYASLITGANGKVIIGATSLPYGAESTMLYVNGSITASNFITGDIIMQKGGQTLWRMFEEPDGVYLESMTTGKVYRINMEEVSK